MKGDVLDFVSTIQKDVVQAMDEMNTELSADSAKSKVVGVSNQSLVDEIASNRSTFTEEVHHHEFANFRERFMIDDYVGEIARLLTTSAGFPIGAIDEYSYSADHTAARKDVAEDNISTYYSELVPHKLSQEEFWARYFFRVSRLTQSISASASAIHLDACDEDDEEENIPWDDDVQINTISNSTSIPPPSGVRAPQIPSADIQSDNSTAIARVAAVAEENMRLLAENRSLLGENAALVCTVNALKEQVAVLTAQLTLSAGCTSAVAKGIAVGRDEVEVKAGPENESLPNNGDKDVDSDEVEKRLDSFLHEHDHDLRSSSTVSLDSSVDGVVVVRPAVSVPVSLTVSESMMGTKSTSRVFSMDSSVDEEEEESWD